MSYPNRETRLSLFRSAPPRDIFKEEKNNIPQSALGLNETEGFLVSCPTARTLDISGELESNERIGVPALKPGFGMRPRETHFGLKGKRTLLRAGAALEQEGYAPEQILFFTGTLPGSTHEAMAAIADYSSFLVHRLKAWVNWHVPEKLDFYVWELQKRGALHLHYAVCCRDYETGERLLSGFKAQWIRLLDAVSELSGVDVYQRSGGGTWAKNKQKVQAYAQRVRKSVAAYLAKYCGKGSDSRHVYKDGRAICPTRWWGVSRPLMAILKKHTHEICWNTLSARKARIAYEDLTHFMGTLSEKCYSYSDKAGFCNVTVSYGLIWSIYELWSQTMNNQTTSQSHSFKDLKPSEWTTTQLTLLARQCSASPDLLSREYSPFSGRALEKLFHSASLNIVEVTEIASALSCVLSYRFRDRNKPAYYEKSLKTLQQIETRWKEIRVEYNLSWEETLQEADLVLTPQNSTQNPSEEEARKKQEENRLTRERIRASLMKATEKNKGAKGNAR